MVAKMSLGLAEFSAEAANKLADYSAGAEGRLQQLRAEVKGVDTRVHAARLPISPKSPFTPHLRHSHRGFPTSFAYRIYQCQCPFRHPPGQ